MTRRCILHIGMNKTGTTSVQNCFHRFDDGRLRYADLGRANHSRPLQLLYGGRWQGVAEADLPMPQFRDLSRGPLRSRFMAQLEDRSRDMLISAEGLTNGFQAEDVTRLLADLRPHFDRIEAVGYLRAPEEFMRSGWQQRLRDRFTPLDPALLYPAYRTRLGAWVDALGDAVDLRLFDRAALVGGDVVTDLADQLGVAPPDRGKRSANSTLNAHAFALLYAFRRAQSEAELRPDLVRERPLIGLLKTLPGPRFAIAAEAVRPELDQQAEDIAWAEARMGQTFPTARPAGVEDVVFAREADILDHAATVRRTAWTWAGVRALGRQRALSAPVRAQTRALLRMISARPILFP